MSTNEELIGRADVNDLEAILAVTNTDAHAVVHAVQDNADAIFTWDYEKGARPALNKLYEKAKTSQWNVTTDIDWSIPVDRQNPERQLLPDRYMPQAKLDIIFRRALFEIIFECLDAAITVFRVD